MASPALISLLHVHSSTQHHWWLPDDGFPQSIASLLGAALQSTSRPPHGLEELLSVFEPLPSLGAADACPVGQQASYRYLIRMRPWGAELSCWRRYPEGIGWQRRCGPMPLSRFVRRFSGAPHPASS
ncbi:hypothetical protein [Synechococcus sp. GFB01]|uniref:hypothetical protein n=1 Tax=Synechococcus sp. GFB01 TaxID=1662190 RepID=UPI00064E3E32|nr:hypothetical protein [Synechococcus sp. GFB01]KMM17710.1 hypothetical protein SYNGFB01_02095 [Synechococcus sp. GFB01]